VVLVGDIDELSARLGLCAILNAIYRLPLSSKGIFMNDVGSDAPAKPRLASDKPGKVCSFGAENRAVRKDDRVILDRARGSYRIS
jgi:hypothetical protein